VVDSAQLSFELEIDGFIFSHEFLVEAHHVEASLTLPRFEILPTRKINQLAERAVSILMNDCPQFFDGEPLPDGATEMPRAVPFLNARACVDRGWKLKTESPGFTQSGLRDFGPRLVVTLPPWRHESSGRMPLTISSPGEAIYKNRGLEGYNSNVDVDAILIRLDISRCPATKLYLEARKKRAQADRQAIMDNDVDDWMYVPVVPYADVVMTERNLASYLRQADPCVDEKVTHDPKRAVSLLQKWC